MNSIKWTPNILHAKVLAKPKTDDEMRKLLSSGQGRSLLLPSVGRRSASSAITQEQRHELIGRLNGTDDVALYRSVAQIYRMQGRAADIGSAGNEQPVRGLISGGTGILP